MWRRLYSCLVIVCIVVIAFGPRPVEAAKDSVLDSFYVVAHVFSDASPGWFEYILDVQPGGTGSAVRHVRIAPASEFCPGIVTIRAMEKGVGSSPTKLLAGVSLCSMNVKDYDRTIARVTNKRQSIDDTVAYTVVAYCEGTRKLFAVPYLEQVDLKALRQRSPDAAHIVDLYSQLEKSVFPNEPINGMNHPHDYDLQVTAQSFLPELKSGRFDVAFDKGRLREMLEMYLGPVRVADQQPMLLDNKWRFLKFVSPVYPPLGRQARIQAKVQLELTIDVGSGQVTDVRVLTGHPILNTSATDAARQWVFDRNQDLPDKITVTLDYSLGCRIS